jgi:hypothetical protein
MLTSRIVNFDKIRMLLANNSLNQKVFSTEDSPVRPKRAWTNKFH